MLGKCEQKAGGRLSKVRPRPTVTIYCGPVCGHVASPKCDSETWYLPISDDKTFKANPSNPCVRREWWPVAVALAFVVLWAFSPVLPSASDIDSEPSLHRLSNAILPH